MDVKISVGPLILFGELALPQKAKGLVLFAHGSGSGRHSPRNQFVAKFLQSEGLGTLLFDLLTEKEETVDDVTRELRFNIPLLTQRLVGATDWILKEHALPIGYFGASTGAAASLKAAAERPVVKAVVSRGGRPDLAAEALPKVKAPTLLIVGGYDLDVIDLNKEAIRSMKCVTRLEIVPEATHLFEEPGKLEAAARLAASWFLKYL